MDDTSLLEIIDYTDYEHFADLCSKVIRPIQANSTRLADAGSVYELTVNRMGGNYASLFYSNYSKEFFLKFIREEHPENPIIAVHYAVDDYNREFPEEKRAFCNDLVDEGGFNLLYTYTGNDNVEVDVYLRVPEASGDLDLTTLPIFQEPSEERFLELRSKRIPELLDLVDMREFNLLNTCTNKVQSVSSICSALIVDSYRMAAAFEHIGVKTETLPVSGFDLKGLAFRHTRASNFVEGLFPLIFEMGYSDKLLIIINTQKALLEKYISVEETLDALEEQLLSYNEERDLRGAESGVRYRDIEYRGAFAYGNNVLLMVGGTYR